MWFIKKKKKKKNEMERLKKQQFEVLEGSPSGHSSLD